MSVFAETAISKSECIRIFDASTDPELLVWHYDEEHRELVVLEGSDWFLLFEWEEPIYLEIGKSYIVPKGKYHKLLKSTNPTSLKIKILKSIKEQ
jgi:hypothetical protein